ncbi:MAG: ectonucleotide pyrophosphatase/phosphodiesterase [Woeseiaceae bacterium]|nr:ectonucleotide pyrophosphatase/phosphodiesterase [Woeseiaceae bacterium]
MRSLAVLIAAGLLVGCATIPDDDPIVVLISIDGLGPRVMQSVDTPTLDALSASGLTAGYMQPIFPTMTFPNHYSIATGLYPAEHGIVNNTFPNADRSDWYTLYDRSKVQDGRWYGGDPVWVLAEQNGLTAKSYYFVGTEADISGVRPTVAFNYDADVTGTERVDTVLEWLALPAAERPRFVTLYFEEVDTNSHRFGPWSARSRDAVRRVDGYLRRLIDGVNELPIADRVHYVVVSDHGLDRYRINQDVFVLDTVINLDGARIVEGGSYLNLFDPTLDDRRADEICEIVNRQWQHGNCYTRRSAPAEWRVTDDPRYPEALMVADVGFALISTEQERSRITIGDHGWPPEAASMRAIFIASGPRINKQIRIEAIRVIDVYPLLLKLLDLPAPREFPEEQRVLLDYVVNP